MVSIAFARPISPSSRTSLWANSFRDFKDNILRFARDWRVPYTNNTAERAIRCARVKEKVSGCFRTKSGADDFARVLSFISSAALHGVSSFDAIVAAFQGDAVRALFGVD